MQRPPPALMVFLLASACVNLTRPPELSQPAGGEPEEGEQRPPGDAATASLDGPAPDAAVVADAPESDQPARADAPVADQRPPDAPLSPNAARCDRGTQCQSGVCADGICCATACDRQCFACNLPASVGACKPYPAGQARAGECPAEPVATCGRDGTCDGQGACRHYPRATVCVPGSCTGATEVSARTCDGNGTCVGASNRPCAPNVCTGGSCGTRCGSQADCQQGFFCDAAACKMKRGNGEGCKDAVECGSGNCVDGVCCSSPCQQGCLACNVPGSLGNCVAVPAGEDPHESCPTDPVQSCGRDGACDGRGGCRTYPAGTECVAATCSDGIALSPRACDNLGNCGRATPLRDCGTFACAGASCGSTCAMTSECQGSAQCTAGACAVPDLVLYWKLDEAAGTTAEDASGNGLAGTYAGETGIPTPSAVLPPVKFLDGASRAFSSAGRQMVEIAPMPALLKPTGNVTLTAWYRATAVDVNGTGGEVISGGNNYLLRIRPGDVEYDKRATSGGNEHIRCFAAVGNQLDGNWHHLALVIDDTQLRGYFDGVQRCATPTTAQNSYDLGTAFRVGRHGQTADSYDFDGNIDEVRVYRRALSPTDVAALAAGGR
jgi:hypothetical protein